MTENNTDAGNQWQAYVRGWRCGAKGGVPDDRLLRSASRKVALAYQDGYNEGRRAANVAAHAASLRYGYAPSPLRDGAE